MTFRQFELDYQKLLLFALLGILPFITVGAVEDEIGDKRMRVAMRTIGHEVLMSLNDCESRVMPIEQVDDQYKIPFEREFGFDPGDIVSIVHRVMTESRVATNYLVEVEQCDTKEVVHSFEIGNTTNLGMVACSGRILPKNCYSLIITLLEGSGFSENQLTAANENSSASPGSNSDNPSSGYSKNSKASPISSAFLILPSIFLIGFIGYKVRKRNIADSDPNVITIGSSQFDKRNMTISFEDKTVELSNKEAELLSLLHTSANVPMEREVILRRVWGDEGAYVGRTLDVFISKLRKKLEADASVKIVNLRGVGYKLVMDMPG